MILIYIFMPHNERISLSAASYNQPKFFRNARWNPDAISVLNATQSPFYPSGIFLNRNNTLYVVANDYDHVITWVAGEVNFTRTVFGDSALFVTDNNDVYVSNARNGQLSRESINATTSLPVMFISAACGGVFVDINSDVYCSATDMHQVVARSLNAPTYSLRMVAGTGCPRSEPNMLAHPYGIFVDVTFSLYVADTHNDRIQRFMLGQVNATTVAGFGAPGTIVLSRPRDVVLDGNGYLFIVDTDNHRIIGSGVNGFRCIIGCLNQSGSASHQLSSPASMSFDSLGNIWVADYNNHRIQKFLLKSDSSGRHHSLSDSGSCITRFVIALSRTRYMCQNYH